MDYALKDKRIKLISMNGEPYPIKPNTMGTIQYTDDMGQLQVIWDDGRRLAVIPNIDEFIILN